MHEVRKIALFLGVVIVLSVILNHSTAATTIIDALGKTATAVLDAANGVTRIGAQTPKK